MLGRQEKYQFSYMEMAYLDYALCTEDGEEELWNSNDGYDILIIGDNCKLELQQSNL